MEEIKSTYESVLGVELSDYEKCLSCFKYIYSADKLVFVDDLMNEFEWQIKSEKVHILSLLSSMKNIGVLESGKGRKRHWFKCSERSINNEKWAKNLIRETYKEKIPIEVEEHFNDYGFEELVASVSVQINSSGQTRKTINEDELWIGRYIDFLDEAQYYLSWRENDIKMTDYLMKKLKKDKNELSTK